MPTRHFGRWLLRDKTTRMKSDSDKNPLCHQAGASQPAKHRRQTFLGLCDWFFYVESRRSPPSSSAEGHLGPGLFYVCSTTLYNSTASREPLSLRSTIKPGLDLWLWSFQGRIGHKNTQKTSHHHFSNSSQRTATRDSLSSASSPLLSWSSDLESIYSSAENYLDDYFQF